MECPSCSAICPDASSYCGSCGTKLPRNRAVVCSQCHHPVPEGRFFCPSCGNNVGMTLNAPKDSGANAEASGKTNLTKTLDSGKIIKPTPPPPPEPERVLYEGKQIQGMHRNKQSLGCLSITNRGLSFKPHLQWRNRCEFDLAMKDIHDVKLAWMGKPTLLLGLLTLTASLSLLYVGNSIVGYDYLFVSYFSAVLFFVMTVPLLWHSSTLWNIIISTNDGDYQLVPKGENRRDRVDLLNLIYAHKGKA